MAQARTDRAEMLNAMPGEGHPGIPSFVCSWGQVRPAGPFPEWGSRVAGRGLLPADQCANLHKAQGCLSAALQQLPQDCQ